jgi:hypothetical protein
MAGMLVIACCMKKAVAGLGPAAAFFALKLLIVYH